MRDDRNGYRATWFTSWALITDTINLARHTGPTLLTRLLVMKKHEEGQKRLPLTSALADQGGATIRVTMGKS
jgi:hypothetical protein